MEKGIAIFCLRCTVGHFKIPTSLRKISHQYAGYLMLPAYEGGPIRNYPPYLYNSQIQA